MKLGPRLSRLKFIIVLARKIYTPQRILGSSGPEWRRQDWWWLRQGLKGWGMLKWRLLCRRSCWLGIAKPRSLRVPEWSGSPRRTRSRPRFLWPPTIWCSTLPASLSLYCPKHWKKEETDFFFEMHWTIHYATFILFHQQSKETGSSHQRLFRADHSYFLNSRF